MQLVAEATSVESTSMLVVAQNLKVTVAQQAIQLQFWSRSAAVRYCIMLLTASYLGHFRRHMLVSLALT